MGARLRSPDSVAGREGSGPADEGSDGRRRRSGPAGGPATLREVAARAGVSVSTASRVLGGRTARPRAGNAEALAAAVDALGYRADLVARSMRTGVTSAIGVVIDNLLDPVFPGMVQAIGETAAAAGYATILGTAVEGPDQAALEVESMLGRRVDGLIVACSWPAERVVAGLAHLPIPVVLANTDGPGGDLPQVGTDNHAGGWLAGDHLAHLGHRRIAYVGGPASAPFHSLRLAGMRDAWLEHGLDPSGIVAARGDGSMAWGVRAARWVVRLDPDVTAVACYNDTTAIGVLRGLADAGVDVPGGMSVIGFDDIEAAAWMEPPLTTVHQETREIGRLAAECLIDLLRPGDQVLGEPAAPVRFPMALRIRASTAPPPG